MNLLFLIDSLHTGGAEKLVVDTANYLLRDKGMKVFIVTTVASGGELINELDAAITYTHIPCHIRNIFSGIRRLKAFIRNNHITHVHAHLYHSMIVARFTKTKTNKLFFTYHNMEYDKNDIFYSRKRILLDKWTMKDAYTSVFVSAPVMKVVQQERGVGKNDRVLYNYPSGRFSPCYQYKENEQLKILSVGNLKAAKNFNFLIEAWSQLGNEKILLDIYGDGEKKTELETLIKKTGVVNVNLKGKAFITSELLCNYDAFIMSSHSEGMPVALIEAMASGLPSVLPDHLQVMKDLAGDSAVYYSIYDKSSLVSTLHHLSANKKILSEMSKIALMQSKEFSLEKHMQNLLAIYT